MNASTLDVSTLHAATAAQRAASRRTPLHAPTLHKRLRVTRTGWAAFALTGWILAAAVMSHASLILLVFCMFVATVAGGAIQTICNLRRLQAVRRLPDHAVAGRPFHVNIELTNGRWLCAARAFTVSALPQAAGNQDGRALFVRAVPAGARVIERQEVLLPDRGLYRFPPLELSTQFPFGFLEQRLCTGQREDLLVFPRTGKLRRRFLEIDYASHLEQVGRHARASVLEGDYHGLRDFRIGDSARWIHWATSARRGRLMVKEFETPRNRDVAVLIDPWLPHEPDAYHRLLLERAISFAATLFVELCARPGLHLVLGIAGSPPLVRHGQASERLLRELLAALALVEGTALPRWEELFRDLPPKWLGQMRVTVVSPRALKFDPGYEAARRHGAIGTRGLAARINEVDVGSREAREIFDLP